MNDKKGFALPFPLFYVIESFKAVFVNWWLQPLEKRLIKIGMRAQTHKRAFSIARKVYKQHSTDMPARVLEVLRSGAEKSTPYDAEKVYIDNWKQKTRAAMIVEESMERAEIMKEKGLM